MNFYTLNLVGLKRQLPIVSLGPKLKIASFNLLGDGEMVEKAADEIAKRLKKISFDVLVGPEVKVVPLLHALSQRLGKQRYVILRKNIMGYMVSPITGKGKPTLVLNGPDAQTLQGKKVVIVDDVISTGRTIRVATDVVESAGAQVVAVACILRQGEQREIPIEPFFYLDTLPLFNNRGEAS